MPRIHSAIINARGELFDEKKKYEFSFIKIMIIFYSFRFELLHKCLQT